MDYTSILYEMKKVAITAGIKVMEIYRTDFEVLIKDDDSPVTKADLAANEIIIGKLNELYPEIAILSEESADDLSRLENDYCFIIDPIDGTKEFVSKNGEFTVNIALAYKHEIILGVIYAPVLEELYYAEKGKGSYRVKDREIQKLEVSDRTHSLRVAESRSHKTANLETLYTEYKDQIEKVYEVGSTLKGCFLAWGRIDCFYKLGMGTKEWDIAAMDLIVTEAGGLFRDLNHEKIIYNRKDVYNRHGYYALNREENKFDYSHLL